MHERTPSGVERSESGLVEVVGAFASRLAGAGTPQAEAAKRAAAEFQRKDTPSSRGLGRAHGFAALLMAMATAVAGCEEGPTREEVMTMSVQDLQDRQRSDHGPAAADLELRRRRDEQRLHDLVDRFPYPDMAARIIDEQHWVDLGGVFGDAHRQATLLFMRIESVASEQADDARNRNDLLVGDYYMHAWRRRIVHALHLEVSRQLRQMGREGYGAAAGSARIAQAVLRELETVASDAQRESVARQSAHHRQIFGQ